MSDRILRLLTYLLSLSGLLLMLAGGVMWWEQSRLESTLLAQSERVLFAVTAQPTDAVPEVLPESPEQSRTPTPAPSPTLESGSATAAAKTPTVPPTATHSPTPTLTPTPDPFPPAASPPTRLVAPDIGLDASVVAMGWAVKSTADGQQYSEWVVPAWAAGWHKNSLLPGHGGNTVLSGHHNVEGEVFRNIVELEPGNEVTLETPGGSYRYRVEEKYIVKEKGEPIEVRRENNRFIENTDDERLTLVSCWPYETNTHRVVVIARPIIETGTPPPSETESAEAGN